MSDIKDWSTTAASNNDPSPDGFPEGMAPSQLNNASREVMAAIRRQHEDAQWIDLGDTPAYASTTTFTITGDITATYHAGRRLKLTDLTTLYGTITGSSYSSPNTTITVSLDIGSLSASLSSVAIGVLSATNASIPTDITLDSITLDSTSPVVRLQADANSSATIQLVEEGVGDVGAYIYYDGASNSLEIDVGNNPVSNNAISIARDTANVTFAEDVNIAGNFTVGAGSGSPKIISISPIATTGPLGISFGGGFGASAWKIYRRSSDLESLRFEYGSVDPVFTLDNTGVEVFGTLTGNNADFSGNLTVGSNDTTRGSLSIYGDGTGSANGGGIRLYTAADYDTTVNFWEMIAVTDDLLIQEAGGTDWMLFNKGADEIQFGKSVDMSGNLDVSTGTNKNLSINPLTLTNYSNEGVGITFSRTSSDDDLMALGVVNTDRLGLFSRSGIQMYVGGGTTYSAVDTLALEIDSAANIGIGVTPKTWLSTLKAFQIGGNGSISAETAQGSNANMIIAQNVYNDGSNKRISTDEASRNYQNSGRHIFQSAATGAANSVITSWTTQFKIEANGDIDVLGSITFGSQNHVLDTPNAAFMSYKSSDATNTQIRLLTSDGVTRGVLAANSTNEIKLLNNSGTEVLGLDSSGNLDVSGQINNLTVGRGAGDIATNTAVGSVALNSNTTGDSNTANGYQALYFNTTGIQNTANGLQALFSNTEGINNTANGLQALYSNTTGNYNVANGSFALYSNITGINNTATGVQVLYYNTTGSNNTATGRDALLSNTTGNSNTANGYRALYSNTTGSNNTANGLQALYFNSTGNYNTANGRDALYFNTTGDNNTANGYQALYQSGKTVTAGSFVVGVSYTIQTTGSTDFTLIGAANNNPGTVFTATGVGTGTGTAASNTDNNTANGSFALFSNTTGSYNVANGYQALYSNTIGIQNTANGVNALYFNSTGSYNVANGYQALYSNTTGFQNTANGFWALYSNTTGTNNTANGLNALYNNIIGIQNTANGVNALYSNTTGNYNTANGYQSLRSNTTADNNVANGYQALYSNTTGNSNTANGMQALYSNTTGYHNTANGYRALYFNTTGIRNTANGYMALYVNDTGDNNVANGYRALYSNTTGNENTAFGNLAGDNLTTGSNNTVIGNGADASIATVSNEITLGNSSIATLRCQVTTITSLSDGRDKADVAPLPAGLDFIAELKPVAFIWNTRDGAKVGVADTGFIAQDLQAAQANTGHYIPGLVYDENPEKLEAGYGKLIPVLVKAIQEQQQQINSLMAEISTLKGNK